MSYAGLSKLLLVPDGFEAPQVLTHGDLTARPLSRECLADDVRAINADRDLINATRGGGWPDGPTSEEDDYVDVSWWVTTEAYEQGLYEVVYEALKKWVPAHYPFRRPHFSNVKVPGQA